MSNKSSLVRADSFAGKKLNIPRLTVYLMIILTALTGLFNQTLLSIGLILCCLLLFLYNKLHLALPFVLFYNSFYGLVFGVSVLRVYTLLILASAVFNLARRSSVKLKYVLPILVYTVFIISTMIPAIGLTPSMTLLIDIIACFMIVIQISEKSVDTVKDIFKIYSVVALISFFTGIVMENTIGDEYNYTRYMATFEDPNYMGLFFTVAVFALVTLKLFDKRIRVIFILALYSCIIATLSITAILVNIVLWLIYLTVTKRIKIRVLVLIIILCALLFSLYQYSLDNPSTPVLGDLAARINEKLLSLEEGDIGDVTTGRSNLTLKHLEYYFGLPILNVLFGGVPSNTKYIHPELVYAAHNEFVDMLLNVGFIGALIMLFYFFRSLGGYFKDYTQTQSEKSLFLIMSKSVWLLYALALTMFLDYRFMILFII